MQLESNSTTVHTQFTIFNQYSSPFQKSTNKEETQFIKKVKSQPKSIQTGYTNSKSMIIQIPDTKLHSPRRISARKPPDSHKRPRNHTSTVHRCHYTWSYKPCNTAQRNWTWTPNPTSQHCPKAPNSQSPYNTLHSLRPPHHALQPTPKTWIQKQRRHYLVWAPQRGMCRP